MTVFTCLWSHDNCASEIDLHTQLQGCINSEKPPQGLWKFHILVEVTAPPFFLYRHMSFTSQPLDRTKASPSHSTRFIRSRSCWGSLRSLDGSPAWPWLCCFSSDADGLFKSMDLLHSLLKQFFFSSFGQPLLRRHLCATCCF